MPRRQAKAENVVARLRCSRGVPWTPMWGPMESPVGFSGRFRVSTFSFGLGAQHVCTAAGKAVAVLTKLPAHTNGPTVFAAGDILPHPD